MGVRYRCQSCVRDAPNATPPMRGADAWRRNGVTPLAHLADTSFQNLQGPVQLRPAMVNGGVKVSTLPMVSFA